MSSISYIPISFLSSKEKRHVSVSNIVDFMTKKYILRSGSLHTSWQWTITVNTSSHGLRNPSGFESGSDWFSGFMKCHPNLSIRNAQATSLSRATSFNRPNVERFFKKLGHLIEKQSSSGGESAGPLNSSLSCSTDFSPSALHPFPKAGPRKTPSGKRKKRQSEILTHKPVKQALEEVEKKRSTGKCKKKKRINLPSGKGHKKTKQTSKRPKPNDQEDSDTSDDENFCIVATLCKLKVKRSVGQVCTLSVLGPQSLHPRGSHLHLPQL
ncbi:uncharacterized protein LOC127434261 [Myxocyprinus asiaticus]|uniref:uncharacterized protein LOC127434261 n=1 Tax=Myxocyprinus asiaticus TaxID=70543 RepID=UPI0022222150|nr:uncharacterized protein LOC127434261 [Myxocyprinus asiaticus]